MKLHLKVCCLWGMAIFGMVVVPGVSAQDDTEAKEATPDTPAGKKSEATPSATPQPKTVAEIRAEEAKRKSAIRNDELRTRLANTVWNDLDLDAGSPGQVWMLRPPKQVGKRVDRAWYLNDDRGLSRVGSWEMKEGQLLLTAMNGSLVGKGTYDDDEEVITGKFIDADHHREYGQFRLREETKRSYRVLPMRREDFPRRR